ncbi:MAG: V-type ATP synthase subunit D [Candidatus Brocadiia bacterium]|nr:V-type ATP synthase subunit D [Candidatus Brocadiia bacterium]
MARLRINPTRMELMRLKRRLAIAVHGHGLLKDKLEGLMKEFMDLVERYRVARQEFDDAYPELIKLFVLARVTSSAEIVEAALTQSQGELTLAVTERNLLSVRVPQFEGETGVGRGYSLLDAPLALDEAVAGLREFLPKVLELAGLDQSIWLLMDEIQRTRRRVNALEYVMIPDIRETIKYIQSKLDENERSNITRLMKIKDMRLAQEREAMALARQS